MASGTQDELEMMDNGDTPSRKFIIKMPAGGIVLLIPDGYLAPSIYWVPTSQSRNVSIKMSICLLSDAEGKLKITFPRSTINHPKVILLPPVQQIHPDH